MQKGIVTLPSCNCQAGHILDSYLLQALRSIEKAGADPQCEKKVVTLRDVWAPERSHDDHTRCNWQNTTLILLIAALGFRRLVAVSVVLRGSCVAFVPRLRRSVSSRGAGPSYVSLACSISPRCVPAVSRRRRSPLRFVASRGSRVCGGARARARQTRTHLVRGQAKAVLFVSRAPETQPHESPFG